MCWSNLKFKPFLSLSWAICCILLGSCKELPTEALISGTTQGTTFHIKFVLAIGHDNKRANIQSQITAMLADIDTKLSNYRQDSEISLLNQKETTDWLSASPEIIHLLTISQTVYFKSQGCFDLTVQPLFDLWGFSKHKPKIPTQADIDRLLPHIGMELLEIENEHNRFRKKDPKVKIDLSSIAQGYSVGQVAKLLEANGLGDYMVEIGGEMMVKGHKGNKQKWRIGIESPNPQAQSLYKTITLNRPEAKAIMTAGTYHNFFEVNGQPYSHILNPISGWPVSHNLRSVTVIHNDPSWADAWDTALLCMGKKDAIKTIEDENLNVFLIYEEDNQFYEYESKGFTTQ
jgi:FAD:protein FMN transferase